MDELDQLAFDIQAFLFQNIFDATLLGNGLLLKQNKVFSYIDDNCTVLPIVFWPSLTNFNQSTRNFLTSIFDCQEVIDKKLNYINTISGCFFRYLKDELDKNLRDILERILYFKTKFDLNEYNHKYFYQFTKSPYFFKLENNCFLLSWKIPKEIFNDIYNDLCDIFPKGKILPNLNVYVESNLQKDNESHITIRVTDEYGNAPVTITNEILLELLLGTLYLFANYSEKHDLKLFSLPSSLVKNVTLKQLKDIFSRFNNSQHEYNQLLKSNIIDTHRFIFVDYKFEPIQLPVIQEVINTNLPAVSQSPNPLPVAPANPYYPYTTQVQPNPYFFLPTQYGNQYYPPYSYQNIPSLIVTIPPINQRTVNYEFTYKWINEQYTKTNHKDQFESELLFLYRVEFELLKKIKMKEDIHPFNLDRPLFTIFSNTPEDISKNKPHAIQLRPFDFYSYKLNDSQTTIYDTLSEQQKEIISISYALENPSQLYSQEAEKFKQMNAWGTLYLLHNLLYQQTEKVEHDWESMIATAQEVAERFAISTDEVKRHIIPTDINDERLYSESPLSNRGDFSEAMEITPQIILNGFLSKEFKGKNNQIYYHAIKLPELDFYIPEIFVSVSYLDFPVPMLLPPKIHHLFHEEYIRHYNGLLYITSDLSNATSCECLISWWGGEKTLDKVDMTILQGKDIAYICNGFEDFELSLKVCARMKEYGAKPKIHYVNKDYQENEFFTLANQLGYENDMHGFMESQQPQKQSGTKIEIIKEYFSTRELILLLGEAKVGKTFVGLSLALSIASQMPMNDYWIPNEQFKGDIYYCFGEMDDNDIAERIYTLTEHMELCVTSHETENSAKKEYSLEKNGNKEKSLFTVDLRNLINGPFDITLPEHQEVLNKILNIDNNGAFIVFDNYVSILGGSTSIGDAKFNTAFIYFMTLMDKGTCVMLAHHTNSEKEIAASKQIERKVDGVIRLTTNNIIEDEIYQYAYQLQRKPLPDILPEELRNKLYKRYCNKGLNIFVTYQYFRDKNTEDLTPLHMILDLKNKGTRWVCEEIIREEIINTITDILTRNTDNNPKGSGDYEMLKKLSPDEAKQYIYKTVLNECNGDINEAIRKPLNSIAQMYGQTDDTFAFHVGRNILGTDGRAKIKQIHDFIKDIHEKAHNQQ